ncbi:hypothetical protein JTM27_33515, partial [Pseudomonas aeruginosa]|nr:hypothetical protein [Pseudomonas aeruginosa]
NMRASSKMSSWLHLDSGLLEGFGHALKAVVEAGRSWVLIVSGRVQRIATLRQLHPQSRSAGLPGFPSFGALAVLLRIIFNCDDVTELSVVPRFKLFSHVRHGQSLTSIPPSRSAFTISARSRC